SVFGVSQRTGDPAPASTPLLADAVLLDKARQAKNGAKFTSLWSGDWTGYNYNSQSEADLGLCGILAFWTQDAAQIDRLFRSSALLRNKWAEKHGAQTYGERTIAEALARQSEHYRPGQAHEDPPPAEETPREPPAQAATFALDLPERVWRGVLAEYRA